MSPIDFHLSMPYHYITKIVIISIYEFFYYNYLLIDYIF